MISWIITFFVLAIIAGGLGFTGLAATFGIAAQFLTKVFILCLVIGILLSILGYIKIRGKK